MSGEQNFGFETRALHFGKINKKCGCCITAELSEKDKKTENFSELESQKDDANGDDSVYKQALEKCLARLENSQYALAYPSGMGSVTAVTQLIKSGSHVICATDCYGGTYGIFEDITSRMGIEVTFVNTYKIENIVNALRENTKLIITESASNPLLCVTDIAAVAEIIKGKDIILAVDNTFLTPYFYRPLESGAHIVIHAATKYLNGHSDVTMGILAMNDNTIYEKLKSFQQYTQNKPSSFDCSLVHDGLKTLSIRMRQHMENALEVAKFLEKHPAVERVFHPLLPSHPQHELAKRQHSGCHSGMVSIHLKGGLEESRMFLKSIKVIQLAESLGGVESNAKYPYLMPPEIPPERRPLLGFTPNLIRFSIGIESVQDLINDLDQALSLTLSMKSLSIE